ncbi:[NiFe]-hydrogenase assembly chaperone HybE [Rhizobium sp. LEGMi198b]
MTNLAMNAGLQERATVVPALGAAETSLLAFVGRTTGIVATPWFMILPAAGTARNQQAGMIEFIAGKPETTGGVDCCLLFSMVFEFGTMRTALKARRAFSNIVALAPPPTPTASPMRRDLLWRNIRAPRELAA